ncbi:MAG: PEP-CTERM sorting domain-containing protein [Gammaproteobacteria bacterium]|jgi:hypothetical protein|nr:PEP-CTERM sorting domain-containing protein [Gammaproteobacteria bacterium]MBT7082588.1 PEP-CTERM sorting domain-containing protein [Chloroflexota bacterium]MBT3725678.1 PEP-CTERM sorting domain-containing protein [Gammaproteobacteria bacterium]MBT4195434.1 PEP-CTERM sorting domain-containing protein [Gammaproteobacteria bacterium]MBT4449459.1 PEP-CTERM sorting domain-containing protein [Gammaproteobacteria bacterium]
MKKLLIILLFSLASQAQAAIIPDGSQFGFGGFTWDVFYGNFDDQGNGFIDDANIGTGSLAFQSSNDSSPTVPGLTLAAEMSTLIDTAGILSFSWDYETFDGDPINDPFVAFVEDSFFNFSLIDIVDVDGAASQSSSLLGFDFAIHLSADDLFGLSLDSIDDAFGFAEASISNFSFIADGTGGQPGGQVPEPSIFALFGLGLVGLGLVRRKRLTNN